MKRFKWLIWGAIIVAFLFVIFMAINISLPKNVGEIPPPAPATYSAAGTSNNYAQFVAESQRMTLSLVILDSGLSKSSLAVDLTSLELTFKEAEITLNSLGKDATTQGLNYREILELSSPTVDIFLLRGEGSLGELGKTELAAGQYASLKLTIDSIKGRRTNGQLMDIEIADGGETIEVNRVFDWGESGAEIQLALDFDSFAAISQDGTKYTFKPEVLRVIENDKEI